MRAVIYARYSSDKQTEASITDQVRLCRAKCKQEEWTVKEVYSDEAISGTTRLRPGYQALLAYLSDGQVDIIVAESLDRLSRDLEEVARLHKQVLFANAKIVTVSEGEISELHVGLKGTMGALYLKDLADKTRRGLEGRARVGKSAGGISYGYRAITKAAATGEIERGDRQIVENEADVVRTIFRKFADGAGPRAIAKQLNAAGVPGPKGRQWMDTAIRGHAKKGTGILNNELYIGRMIWNRLKYLKDPETAKRVSRLNPRDKWVITDVPDLRIVSDELWDAAKARQSKVSRPWSDPSETNPLSASRRSKFLLSGLLKCGICGGGYTIRAKGRYACSNRANRGTCSNERTITRQEVEERVIGGLKDKMLTPDLVAEFVDAYREEWNRLENENLSTEIRRNNRLAEIKRKISSIMSAIEDGIYTPSTKDRLLALEAERDELQSYTPSEPRPSIHPNLSNIYREKVAKLEIELQDPAIALEAKSILRSMIDKIIISPLENQPGVSIEIYGEIGAILGISAPEPENPPSINGGGLSVVAGVGFEPTTFRL